MRQRTPIGSVPIGELCRLFNGRAFKPSEWGAEGLPIVRIQNLNDESKPFNRFAGGYDLCHEVNDGDLLFSWSGTPGTSFGAFFWNRGKAVLNQHIFNVRVNPSRADKRYFCFALNDRLHAVMHQAHGGVGLQHITKGKLEATTVPIPFPDDPVRSLAEQKRIAAILDKADGIRRMQDRRLVDYAALDGSLFHEAFQRQMRCSKRVALAEVVEEFRYGTSVKSASDGLPTLRIPNVIGDTIDLQDLKTVPVDTEEGARLRLNDGDLLFVRTNGNPDYVGRSAVFDYEQIAASGHDASRFIFASYLIRARVRRGKMHPLFIQRFFRTSEGRKAIRDHCRTSAGQYNINTEGLGQLPLPVVDYRDQLTYIDAVKRLHCTGRALRLAAQTSADLSASLVQRAFRGEL